jgi:hypothetical protein
MRGNRLTRARALAGSCALALAAVAPLAAHKPITSKYSYNTDVYPIFKARCGQCHVAGGPAPMSLLNYKEAIPWAESIREELVAEKMPPSFVDPFGPAVKGAHAITPKELDTIITWATGGTPEGDAGKRPPATEASHDWPMGTPDAVLPMPSEHVVPADVEEETSEFAIETKFAEPRWIKGADLLPGNAGIVRDATISVDAGAVLAAWVPGERGASAPDRSAFALPAGARLKLRIHYKKGWQDERAAKADRSQVGLYFAEPGAAGHAIESVGSNETTGAAVSVVAVRPRLDRAYGSIDVHALLPDGTKVLLLRLERPQPEWPQRYWLEQPIALPANSRIEVTTTASPVDPDAPPKPPVGSLETAVEFVAR